MTGYGSQKVKLNDSLNLIVELKSLNSKNLDVDVKMPSLIRQYEMECRKMISKQNTRGKIVCFVQIETQENISQAAHINIKSVENYLEQLNNIYGLENVDSSLMLSKILSLPGILEQKNNEESYGNEIRTAMSEALKNLNDFKIQEGKSIQAHLSKCIQSISELLENVKALIPIRKELVKTKMMTAIEVLKVEVDETRFYQELTYYFEKIDISEEISRLTQHLHYFSSCLKTEPFGKKLGFIGQEIGREINTIGSKAQNADMQKFVVEMKDNLEQIKEQLFNVE